MSATADSTTDSDYGRATILMVARPLCYPGPPRTTPVSTRCSPSAFDSECRFGLTRVIKGERDDVLAGFLRHQSRDALGNTIGGLKETVVSDRALRDHLLAAAFANREALVTCIVVRLV